MHAVCASHNAIWTCWIARGWRFRSAGCSRVLSATRKGHYWRCQCYKRATSTGLDSNNSGRDCFLHETWSLWRSFKRGIVWKIKKALLASGFLPLLGNPSGNLQKVHWTDDVAGPHARGLKHSAWSVWYAWQWLISSYLISRTFMFASPSSSGMSTCWRVCHCISNVWMWELTICFYAPLWASVKLKHELQTWAKMAKTIGKLNHSNSLSG